MLIIITIQIFLVKNQTSLISIVKAILGELAVVVILLYAHVILVLSYILAILISSGRPALHDTHKASLRIALSFPKSARATPITSAPVVAAASIAHERSVRSLSIVVGPEMS